MQLKNLTLGFKTLKKIINLKKVFFMVKIKNFIEQVENWDFLLFQ